MNTVARLTAPVESPPAVHGARLGQVGWLKRYLSKQVTLLAQDRPVISMETGDSRLVGGTAHRPTPSVWPTTVRTTIGRRSVVPSTIVCAWPTTATTASSWKVDRPPLNLLNHCMRRPPLLRRHSARDLR